MRRPYHSVPRAARESAAIIEQFCQANGQILLPILQLLENASQVVETVIHEIGRQTLEQILRLSAEQVAGPQTPGKASGEVRYHGSQPGRVQLADRKLRVQRPRLRHKTQGEVKIPAYETLREDRGLGQHMLGALLRGISTREYRDVLLQMAETVGVSRSSISRQAIEASVAQLQELQERRWENAAILVIYIDGQRFAAYHIIRAVGVDRDDEKQILGIEPGATENAAAVKRLLVRLRDHGLPTDRKYLFVIDGAKALRAAWKVKTAQEGEKRLEPLARLLEHGHGSAARSLREAMAEMFPLQRLQIPASWQKCLATTNVIESPQSGVERRTGNVTRWRDAEMVERWVASAWPLTEKHFRRIDGHADLWALAAILGREMKSEAQPSKEKVA